MFHPKNEKSPLSPHHCADGGQGEVFVATKHFWCLDWTFTVKQGCGQIVIAQQHGEYQHVSPE